MREVITKMREQLQKDGKKQAATVTFWRSDAEELFAALDELMAKTTIEAGEADVAVVHALEEDNLRLSQELAAQDKLVMQLRDELDEKEQAVIDLRDLVVQLERKAEDLADRMEELKEELNGLRLENGALFADNEALRIQVTDLEIDLDEATANGEN